MLDYHIGQELFILTFNLFLLHTVLAIALFFLVNWLGKHAVAAGYLQFSLYARADEAPVFNFLFRVLAPVIYLFLTASVLYALRLDHFIQNFYLVTVNYVVLRWLYNVMTERAALMNWNYQVVVAVSTISLSYVAYDRLIRIKANVLPDFTTAANELWLGIALFLYTTVNGIEVPPLAAQRRRRAVIRRRVEHLRSRYGLLIAREIEDREVEALVYSVLIYEMFNRPTVARELETRVLFPMGISSTLGIMQVRTQRRITDEESVVLGASQLRRDYEAAYAKLLPKYQAIYASQEAEGSSDYATPIARNEAEQRALKKYNIRSDYASEVLDVKRIIVEEFYPDLLPCGDDDED